METNEARCLIIIITIYNLYRYPVILISSCRASLLRYCYGHLSPTSPLAKVGQNREEIEWPGVISVVCTQSVSESLVAFHDSTQFVLPLCDVYSDGRVNISLDGVLWCRAVDWTASTPIIARNGRLRLCIPWTHKSGLSASIQMPSLTHRRHVYEMTLSERWTRLTSYDWHSIMIDERLV